jgi:hypothetical protein
MDFPGTQKHFTIPLSALSEASFEDGLGFNASSIRGWKAINESDMLVVPQADTAVIDPFMKNTLAITCNIQDPVTRANYPKDPRNVALKAEAYMKSTGLAEQAFFGAEAEFFVFDDVRFDQNEHECYYHVDSIEGEWNRGRREMAGNLGNKIRHKEGYFPVPPVDTLQDLFMAAETLARFGANRDVALTLMTNGGGPGVMAADAAALAGVAMHDLSDATRARLDARLPPTWSHANPIDIIGDAPPERYCQALQIVANDPAADGVLVALAPQGMTDPSEAATQITCVAKMPGKPLLDSSPPNSERRGSL